MRYWSALLIVLLCGAAASAHEVPDHVQVTVFLKPDGGRMRMLVRMPANALIDFTLPTLAQSNWIDLNQADETATSAAQVWIADMLSVFENGQAVPTPQVTAVRISRVNDPSFASFDSAFARVTGSRLQAGTLAQQEQVTVDALLESPIHSPDSSFSFQPRFAWLGIVVDTAVTYLSPRGAVRQFQYRGDPERFMLDPDAGSVLSRFARTGLLQTASDTDHLLLALCLALAIGGFRKLVPFASVLVITEILLTLAALRVTTADWVRVLAGVLMAMTTVYAGLDAIVARGERSRPLLAALTGLVLGVSLSVALQPLLQFGGPYRVAAAVGFMAGSATGQVVALLVVLGAASLVGRVSRAPRAVTIVVAAVAVHVAWRHLLERSDGFALAAVNLPTLTPAATASVLIVAVSGVAAVAYARNRVPTSAR